MDRDEVVAAAVVEEFKLRKLAKRSDTGSKDKGKEALRPQQLSVPAALIQSRLNPAPRHQLPAPPHVQRLFDLEASQNLSPGTSVNRAASSSHHSGLQWTTIISPATYQRM